MPSVRRARGSVLTAQQRIGLQHYEDLQAKIPRAEVALIERTVCDAARAIVPGALAVCCGSYRRGMPSSGDCDVLITLPTTPAEGREFTELHALLSSLERSGFLRAHLSYSSSKDTEGDAYHTANSQGTKQTGFGTGFVYGQKPPGAFAAAPMMGGNAQAKKKKWYGGGGALGVGAAGGGGQDTLKLEKDNRAQGFSDTYVPARLCVQLGVCVWVVGGER